MIEKAHAKVNIFLKMVGTRGAYHELHSRFMRVENLFDTLTFERKSQSREAFELEGEFGCTLAQNSIFKAYTILSKHVNQTSFETFFHHYKVVVDKQIPEFAGLGGGSSDAAAFMRLANQELKLGIDLDTLAALSSAIGADVPFFVYNYPSANVSGVGEIVVPFEEELLTLETNTPAIACDTGKVYQRFREHYLKDIDIALAKKMMQETSQSLLKNYSAIDLNDLFSPAVDLYPTLNNYHHKGTFFSGSGSTFFRINHG